MAIVPVSNGRSSRLGNFLFGTTIRRVATAALVGVFVWGAAERVGKRQYNSQPTPPTLEAKVTCMPDPKPGCKLDIYLSRGFLNINRVEVGIPNVSNIGLPELRVVDGGHLVGDLDISIANPGRWVLPVTYDGKTAEAFIDLAADEQVQGGK